MASDTSSCESARAVPRTKRGLHYEYKLWQRLREVAGGPCTAQDFVYEGTYYHSVLSPSDELYELLPDLYCPPDYEDSLEGCACGKRGIVNMCILRHIATGRRAVVGSDCVNNFIPEHRDAAKRDKQLWKQCEDLRRCAAGTAAPEPDPVAGAAQDAESADAYQRIMCLRQAIKAMRGNALPDAAEVLRIRGSAGKYVVTCKSVEDARALLLRAREHIMHQREAYRATFSAVDVDDLMARGLARDPERVQEHMRLMMRIFPERMPASSWEPVLMSPCDYAITWSAAASGTSGTSGYAAAYIATCLSCKVELRRSWPLRQDAEHRTCDACFEKEVARRQDQARQREIDRRRHAEEKERQRQWAAHRQAQAKALDVRKDAALQRMLQTNPEATLADVEMKCACKLAWENMCQCERPTKRILKINNAPRCDACERWMCRCPVQDGDAPPRSLACS